MENQDTIAAIATPVGAAGIGVIRISGPQALGVASRLFRPDLQNAPSHTAHHGKLHHPASGEIIDDVVATLFRSPASYTGEDVVEISCHGGIAVLKSALGAALAAGARLAEPGEFTRRAFLGGKIDLAQAEAVNDLIRARTDQARKVALDQLSGDLSHSVRNVNDRILGVIAAVEAAIDFPDDVDEPDPQWVEAEIGGARAAIDGMLSSFRRGRIYREGLRLVIAGRVNVGKSSLLNALLRHARAIVTPIPGTTRDVIEESLEIEGIPIVAVDTAGLRATEDPVERIGVERAQLSLASADLVLLVLDASEAAQEADAEAFAQIGDKPAIAVLNKIDLVPEDDRDIAIERHRGATGHAGPIVVTSAPSGLGIDALESEIFALAASSGVGGESAVVSNIRHKCALESARESLAQALATIRHHEPIDLLSVDLAAARASLGLITGETATEDLIERIFSEFCIGK